MRCTFNLKKPNKQGLALIYLKAYFKKEGRKFVYSTGESIHPDEWDADTKLPNDLNGRTDRSNKHKSIKTQLDRYSGFFEKITQTYKATEQELTIENIKKEFDKEFKKTSAISNKFFEVYDLFLKMKRTDYTDEANSVTTIKRYEYNKKLLEDYQKHSKKNIHFNQITKSFYNSFIDYCVKVKKHSANTLRRNVGLLKTFLYWTVEEGHNFKTDFHKFKSPKAQRTEEVALSFEQVSEVFQLDLQKNERLEKVRDLFVFGCATGMRYSNYSKVAFKDIQQGLIKVRDKKDNNKVLEIPLNEFSIAILQKYEYQLPKITNQKFNEYIKEVFELLGYDENIKKTIKIGNEIIEEIAPLHSRISSHTARRSFITIMKNKKIPDKVIMSYTGHTNVEVFNQYYKPNNDEKKDFMESVWKIEKPVLRKVN